MYVPRPSILHRPKRDGSRANEEMQDSEYAREQARIAAKAQRLAQTEERLVGAFYPTADEKRHAWSQAQYEAERLAAARAAAQDAERQREAEWASQPQRVVIDTRRPWNAASSTYYMPAEVEAEARRREQREASEVNRAIAQRRAVAEAQQRSAEQHALHATICAEDTYFNLGAASERWIPPERRIRQRATVPPQFMPSPPPYCCDDELPLPASSVRSRPSTACSSRSECSYASSSMPATAPRPASASRRAQEGQGVAAAMRQHADMHVTPRISSYSDRLREPAAVPAGPAPARPQTAPANQQQRERAFPWSWAS